jgi:hypothetical protein
MPGTPGMPGRWRAAGMSMAGGWWSKKWLKIFYENNPLLNH